MKLSGREHQDAETRTCEETMQLPVSVAAVVCWGGGCVLLQTTTFVRWWR